MKVHPSPCLPLCGRLRTPLLDGLSGEASCPKNGIESEPIWKRIVGEGVDPGNEEKQDYRGGVSRHKGVPHWANCWRAHGCSDNSRALRKNTDREGSTKRRLLDQGLSYSPASKGLNWDLVRCLIP